MTQVIEVGTSPRVVSCGGPRLFLIAGPCVLEERSLVMRVAEELKALTDRLRIPLIFKSSFQKDNRSSLRNYSGPGLRDGLTLLHRVRETFGVPILTDIHHPEQCRELRGVVDVIQIPAYLSMQTDLVVAAAKTGAIINLKRGQFLAPNDMGYPVAKCEQAGNTRLLLTERGYAFGYHDLVVDPRSFYHLRKLGYPVIFDVTHSVRRYGIPSSDPAGGQREYCGVLARAACGAGIDGLFIETHPNPSAALCDAASQMPLSELEEFLKPMLDIYAAEVENR